MRAKSKMFALAGSFVVAVSFVADLRSAQAPAPPRQSAFAPDGTPIALGAGGLCEGAVLGGIRLGARSGGGVREQRILPVSRPTERRGVTYEVDRGEAARPHDARRRDANGEVLRRPGMHHPSRGHDGIFFTPVPVKTRLPDAATSRGRWAMLRRRRRCPPGSTARARRRPWTPRSADPAG